MNANANGPVREYFNASRDSSAITWPGRDHAMERVNRRPRMTLAG